MSHVYSSCRVDAGSHDLSSYRVDVDRRNFLVVEREIEIEIDYREEK